MRRTLVFVVAMSLGALALPAAAQEDGGPVGAVMCFDVQPGAEARFEEALKKHVDWHREQKDTWSWTSWTVMTGPDTGQYCGGTFGHKWEDFDSPAVDGAADEADMRATFLPYVTSREMTMGVLLPDVSRPAEGQSPMSSVIFFNIHFGKDAEFMELIGEFHKAIEKVGVPWNYVWWQLMSGGEAGTYVLVLPRADFASFNPDKPFPQVLAEAYGKAGAEALLDRWSEVVDSSASHLTRSRPDLAYAPEP